MTQPQAEYVAAPHNSDAEVALLGAIFSNNDALDRVSHFLAPEHFHEPLHARIFEAIGNLHRVGKLANPITLRTFFENDATMKELGGIAYLARLAASATTIINAEEYGRTIHETFKLRKLIDIGTGLVNEARSPTLDGTAKALVEKTEQELYGLADADKYGKGFQPFGRAVTDAIDMASAA